MTILRKYQDTFARATVDMTGIPRSIIEHHLNINSSCIPVKQKKCIMAKERNEIVNKEVEALVKVGVTSAT